MVAPWPGYRAPEVPVDLRYREKIEGLVIPLRKAARLAGRIRSRTGQGPPSIRISALRDPGRYAWKLPDRAMATAAAQEGNFVLEGLDPGAYLLPAGPPAPEWRLRHWAPDEPLSEPSPRLAPTFNPGVEGRVLAASIPLLSGEERGGLEWELVEARAYCLQGRAPQDGPSPWN